MIEYSSATVPRLLVRGPGGGRVLGAAARRTDPGDQMALPMAFEPAGGRRPLCLGGRSAPTPPAVRSVAAVVSSINSLERVLRLQHAPQLPPNRLAAEFHALRAVARLPLALRPLSMQPADAEL